MVEGHELSMTRGTSLCSYTIVILRQSRKNLRLIEWHLDAALSMTNSMTNMLNVILKSQGD